MLFPRLSSLIRPLKLAPLALAPLALTLGTALPATAAETFKSPDIVVLGDSQIPFGSGPVFLDFFENFEQHCPPTPAQTQDLQALGEGRVAVIGVRSTSLHSWVARRGNLKGSICNVDPKWKANAGVFGVINQTKNKYAQMGRGSQYQFCKKGKSPFEAMFAPDYYKPKLLMMSFLGNATSRWANSREKALDDVTRMLDQIPAGTPCVFMTTAPAYSKKIVNRRLKAQENIKWAFDQVGAACSFIEGATPATVKANQGNAKFFRRNKSGRVKDPFHPNERAAKAFFATQNPQLCEAVYTQIKHTGPMPVTKLATVR